MIKYISSENNRIRFESLSTKKEYEFILIGGEWKCSCPHATYRRAVCKHIKAFKSGIFDTPPEETKVDEFSE